MSTTTRRSAPVLFNSSREKGHPGGRERRQQFEAELVGACSSSRRRAAADVSTAVVVAFSAVGSDNRRKRSVLIIVVVIASAASTDFLVLGRQLVVLAHLALDCGNGFQFLRRVVPLPSFWWANMIGAVSALKRGSCAARQRARDMEAMLRGFARTRLQGIATKAQEGFGLSGAREPIPLPQRCGLLAAVKNVECMGSDACAVLGPRLVWSENFVVGHKSALREHERLGRLADGKE
jgi:hypothetical protein